MINLFNPYIPQEAIEEVGKVLSSKYIAQGSKVNEFEKEFDEKFKVKYAVSLNSGTSALETAYELVGIGKGDEVITTPLTCTATNIPLLRLGVKIVWADIDPKTLCIDPIDVRNKITNRTKAIVQVHLGGINADLSSNSIIPIISDACQALGIFTGDYTCCSFQAIKHITTGDGGILIPRNKEEYHKAKLLRWFGIDRERPVENNWESYKTRMMSFDIDLLGYKRHMNDIEATLGIEGLKKYDFVLEYRKKLFNLYKELLKGIDGIRVIDGDQNVYWLCTVIVERRDDFAKMLYENGIETNIVQIRNDIYKVFGSKRQDLPVMNELEFKYLSLPLHMKVMEEDVRSICNLIRKGW